MTSGAAIIGPAPGTRSPAGSTPTASWSRGSIGIVCQSFIMGTPFEKVMIKDGVDDTAVEGAADLPYQIPNLAVKWQMAPSGVPVIWLRSGRPRTHRVRGGELHR